MNPDLLQLSPSQARIALDEQQRLRRATERREHERNFDYSHLHPLLRECPFACHYIKDFGLILVLGTNLGITTAFRAALRRALRLGLRPQRQQLRSSVRTRRRPS